MLQRSFCDFILSPTWFPFCLLRCMTIIGKSVITMNTWNKHHFTAIQHRVQRGQQQWHCRHERRRRLWRGRARGRPTGCQSSGSGRHTKSGNAGVSRHLKRTRTSENKLWCHKLFFDLQRGHFFKSKHQSYVSLKRGVIKETKNKTTILSPIIYLALIIVYNTIGVHFQRVRFSF